MSAAAARQGRATIYDVARRAGVSKSLVSLVLRGSSQVSPARREAVLAAIAELGYRPSRAASALAGQRTNTIGVVIDEFANPWFVQLLDGLRRGLEGTPFHVSVSDEALNGHLAEPAVDGFLAARVDGLVIAGEPGDDQAHGVPTVLVGMRLHGVPGADRVVPDDRAGAAAAVGHLRGLGHERIAFISGTTGPAAARERGYRDAMSQAALPAQVFTASSNTEAGGLTAARDLLASNRGSGVSAIVAANDLIALGAWQALREAGRAVPGDVSVVGYDDTPLASSGVVQLTTVDPRNDTAGAEAARLLRARIDDPARPPQTVSVAPRLVLRATTAPARRHTRKTPAV